ncbi:related to RAD26 - DNA repair and recombination protein [Melanopsichium pennsylvanicum]|uniref:Related to RAD26 - DNA repair and recombination protein n=2 Tax=Melanopsichium pennsylvanicum TaxID=63383 RepID=A0AAJ4XHY8_9BASI|nr:related to RAD26-DNA repair and recombination protein [Melanopsichium pennsylvanicum 4]SNX82341.1 related to RAD26 - DNA repair and recombination protein [Melanopsichium pennsylvanicum]
MGRKRSAVLDSSSPYQQEINDEKLLAEQHFDRLKAPKRRHVRPHPTTFATGGRCLRDLLRLTAADDYVDTAGAPSHERSEKLDALSRCLEQHNDVKHSIGTVQPGSSPAPSSSSDSSSTDDELVLPISRAPREPVASTTDSMISSRLDTRKRQTTARHGRNPTASDSDTGDEPGQALGLSASAIGSKQPTSGAQSIDIVAGSDTSEDEDEVALAIRPPAATFRSCTDAAKKVVSSKFSKDSSDGHRPAFPIPSDLLNVGPLELALGVIVPASINRFLRSYQRDGVHFLYKSYAEGRGALLGDDMGLGKTIQVIAFLSAIMGKTGREEDADRRIEAERSDRQHSGYQRADATWPTCLIICPSSVIDNWRDELDTWGYFEHAAFSGKNAKIALDAFRRGRLDILVTSHETASLSIEQLRDLDLSCVLIDEAHKLKNPSSQMTQAMQTFRCKARFALTGTAIQNTYRELYTLADWTNPGLLGTVKEWVTEIEDPLKRGQRRGADPEQIADARTRAEKLVGNVLPIFFLRRTKALIADQLPRKFDKIVFCPLTSTQLDVYKRILAEEEVDLMKCHADPCDCGRLDPETGLTYRRQNCCYKRDRKGEPWSKNMLKYIYLLQKCSNHVALVFPDPEDSSSREADRMDRYERQLSYVQLMFPDSWQSKRCNAANGMEPDFCGKWKVLAGLLQQWHADGDKVLLFSTNIRLLQFIEFFLAREGHNFLRLDGSTPQHRRQMLVNQFNRDRSIFVFLISTTAGGTGLNLTAANRVVVFDPHWNPSHDLQAMDRAYRFGQSRDVYVYRLIGAGSLEEVIYGRQLYKQQQMEIGYNATKERRYFEGVAGDQDSLGELFGCKNLFTLHESSLAMKSIIDECNISEVTFALEQYLKAGLLDDQTSADAALAERVFSQGQSQRDSTTNAERADASLQPSSVNTDPVRSVLEGSGIAYSHDHAALVGNSAAEAALYRKAARQRKESTKGVAKPTRAPRSLAATSKKEVFKKTSTAIWPPQRSMATTSLKGLADAEPTPGETQPVCVAEQDLHRAITQNTRARKPDLSDLAELQNVSEVELAGAINVMPEAERKAFFDDAVRRWTQKQEILAKAGQQQHQFF